MKSEMSIIAAVLLSLATGCDRRAKEELDGPVVPWQPHGLRLPVARCELDVPAGWIRSAAPMPDHIVELNDGTPKSIVIVAERVEGDVATAREAALSYYRSGILRSEGGSMTADSPLLGARMRGHFLSVRWGKSNEGSVETVSLLGFTGVPVIEVVWSGPDSVDTLVMQPGPPGLPLRSRPG